MWQVEFRLRFKSDKGKWEDRPVVHRETFFATMDEVKCLADDKATKICNTLNQVAKVRWNFAVEEGNGQGHYIDADKVVGGGIIVFEL